MPEMVPQKRHDAGVRRQGTGGLLSARYGMPARCRGWLSVVDDLDVIGQDPGRVASSGRSSARWSWLAGDHDGQFLA